MIRYLSPILLGRTVLILLLTVVLQFSSIAQITATIDVNGVTEVEICQYTTDSEITLTGLNGFPPYSFVVQYNDSELQYYETSTTGSSVSFMASTDVPGTYTYEVISVTDMNGTESISEQIVTLNVLESPQITESDSVLWICNNEDINYCVEGTFDAIVWSNGSVENCVNFPPVTEIYDYTVSLTNGCNVTDEVEIVIADSPIPEITATIESSYCGNGSILLSSNPTNIEDVNILWENGSTSPFITNLQAGDYAVTFQNDDGCVLHEVFTVPLSPNSSNCNTISGQVYFDINEDCVFGNDDFPLNNHMIIAQPGGYTTFTNQNGEYTLSLEAGSYTISLANPNYNLNPACAVNQSIDVNESEVISDIDFSLLLPSEVDYSVNAVYISPIRPGFSSAVQIIVSEESGTIDINDMSAWFTIPDGLSLIYCPFPHTISNDTVYFVANSSTSIFNDDVVFHGTDVWLDDVVEICVGIDVEDSNMSNNINCQSTIVIGAYDPNDKTTNINGIPTNSIISLDDETLEYVIRFQNTGTADAIHVYILDTLMQELEPSTFRLIATSHDCQLSIMNNNVLKFDFPYIHLPDSTSNEPESHGFIKYQIGQKNTNEIGTVINNTAYIYFDFNEAIITNTTHDLIAAETMGDTEIVTQNNITIFPNPTNNILNIELNETSDRIERIRICDLSGKIFYTEHLHANNSSHSIYLAETISEGFYFVEITLTSGATERVKFIKQ